MKSAEAKIRIEKLKKEIDYHRYLYHVFDRQEISQAALDSLKHELYKLEQQFPRFITLDSPTQRVGGKPLPEFKKVTHRTPMLSMEDVFSPAELEEWLERVKRVYPAGHYDFYVEIKMDGLAVSLVYENGFLKAGSTRGDGKIGEDVTQNLKTVEAIPLRLRLPSEKEVESFIKKFGDSIDVKKLKQKLEKLDGRIEVRGEAFMSKKVFDELNKEQKKMREAPFANPRNAAAGSIRQLDSKITEKRKLSFYGYALLGDFGVSTHEQTHELMKLLGAPICPLNEYCANLDEVAVFHQKIYKMRDKLPFWTDGIVAVINDDKTFERLGVVGKTPRGAIAFKFPAEQATTRVLEVRWQVGRTGVLTPVAVMEPVFIAGTTVQHATLHNLDEIGRLGLKVGDTVILEKAGDIIPKVTQVLPKLRTGKEKTIHPPEFCPACQSRLRRPEGEVAVSCFNKNCPAKHHERIVHFVSKKAFDIEGMGTQIVKQLMDEGLIVLPADIFKLTKSDLVDLERFGEKSAENLIQAIDKARQVDLGRFIYALGIKHVGEETALDLAKNFGTLNAIRKAGLQEFNSIPNVGDVVARSLFEYFSDRHNQKLVDDLLKAGIQVSNFKFQVSRRIFKGLTFVLTGGLESMSREQAKQRIRELGGDISSSVSKNTDYVVIGSEPGEKYERAKKFGVKIVNEKDFIKMLK